ncbi:cysteine-rich RLK (RECEPTOR-like protein kinase) 8 [Hibiscus trionum]|uniref:Cysteine-rich RLK (RECEPTOR-like protein kinase) 8 n=1 Tax=Hibiscus trionum TaxID=183268 RepID=A0A9W7HJL8_HIBTR|nr:cysteine-rich RLK (RECEPTOR-like protein kinase) 8 [Hibiscus trionum]
MRRQKYTRSKYDHCVYLRKLQDGSFIYLLLYVDDMLIASKSQQEIDKLKAQLNQEFEMKDLGEAKKILGMEISRDRRRGNSQLSPKTDEEREYMAKVPYANAVGSLMYAMVCTRPDISQAVGVVSRYMTLASCEMDSTQKTPVSWRSTLQSTVALSTTEAEYMAVAEAVKEAIWLNGLLEDLGVVQNHISLYCDSQSAIYLAKNQVYHSRTKHIDVRYHFVREIFEEGKILLQKIATTENPADMLTKVVTSIKFNHCLNLINILQV